MGGTNAARSPERVTKSYCRWEVEVEVEVHGVILTRAMLHSRWEVEVQVEVPCVIIENVARAMLWPTMWVSAGDSAL